MVWTIFRRALLGYFKSLRYTIFALLGLILIPFSTWINKEIYDRDRAYFTITLSQYERQVADDPNETNPKAFRKPPSLSIFARGLLDVTPESASMLRDWGVQWSEDRRERNPLFALLGGLDLVALVHWILSIGVLLMAYDALSAEREKQSVYPKLIGPVSPGALLMGTYAAACVAVLLSFSAGYVLTIALLNLSDFPLFVSDHMARIWIVFGITLLYLWALLSMGFAISALARRSISALRSLVLLWLMLVVVIPRVTFPVVEHLMPIRSEESVILERALIVEDIRRQRQELVRSLWEREGQYIARHVWRRMRDELIARMDSKQEAQIRKFHRLRRVERVKQIHVMEHVVRLSPASCYTFAMANVCNTGRWAMEGFATAAEQFYTSVDENIFSGRLQGVEAVQAYILRYDGEHLLDSLKHSRVDLALLILFNMVFLVLALVLFRRRASNGGPPTTEYPR